MRYSGRAWASIIRGKVKDQIVLHLDCQKEAGSTWADRRARDGNFHVSNFPSHAISEFVIAPIRSSDPLVMTAITRNLPWFVKDLGVSIIGQVRTGRLYECALFVTFGS